MNFFEIFTIIGILILGFLLAKLIWDSTNAIKQNHKL